MAHLHRISTKHRVLPAIYPMAYIHPDLFSGFTVGFIQSDGYPLGPSFRDIFGVAIFGHTIESAPPKSTKPPAFPAVSNKKCPKPVATKRLSVHFEERGARGSRRRIVRTRINPFMVTPPVTGFWMSGLYFSLPKMSIL